MIIVQDKIKHYEAIVGNKTINLSKLANITKNVPPFIAISSSTIKKINSKKTQEKVIKAAKTLAGQKLIVRSSGFEEDSQTSSQAGKFDSKVTDINKLIKTIKEVSSTANKILKKDSGKFSLIIQQYIAPQLSGVVFTRNPMGDRDLVINYSGEDVVSGINKTKQIRLLWDQKPPKNKLKNVQNLVKECQKIEKYFKYPQDIEWVLANNKYYFVQSRPITTINNKQYGAYQYLDAKFPSNHTYIYEKNKLIELVEKPSNFTFGLIRKIYSSNGPVAKTYHQFNILYKANPFFKIIKGEIFIDKIKELKTIFPAFTFKSSQNKIKIDNWKEILPTIKNMLMLELIKANNLKKIEENVIKALFSDLSKLDLKETINDFMNKYQLIFAINLLLKKKHQEIEKKQIPQSKINMSPSPSFIKIKPKLIKLSNSWKGNSIEALDCSTFYSPLLHQNKIIDKKYTSNFESYSFLLYLREMGRLLTVKYIQNIRKKILLLGKKQNLKLEEILAFTAKEIIKNKKINHKKNTINIGNDFQLPTLISNTINTTRTNGAQGISSGIAQGKLVNLTQLKKIKKIKEDLILYHENMSIELLPYLKSIKGLISNNGNMLSHLSIIVRENKLPTVVNFSLKNFHTKISLGDRVQINGETGKIKKIL